MLLQAALVAGFGFLPALCEHHHEDYLLGTSAAVAEVDGYSALPPMPYGEPASTGGYGGYGGYGDDGDIAPLPADMMPDLTTLTLTEAQAAFEDGAYTSEELTRLYLAQIAQYEDVYNALTFLNPGALEAAAASDARRAAGKPLGPMEGVPVVVKEALNGLPSTFGWNETSADAGGVNLFPRQNARAVQLLIDAGAVIIGKTNIPAFSLSGTNANTSWAGPTLSAANIERAPGGSSAGTATAVAAGFAVWGIGEETGGSIQNPASAQSLVGIKTTYGVVDRAGLAPLAGLTRDVLGPIAKTVRDAATAYDVLAEYGTPGFKGDAPVGGYGGLIGKETLAGKKLGLYGLGYKNETLSPYVQALYDEAVAQVIALGADVVEDPFAGTGFNELGYYSAESIGYDLNEFVQTLKGIDGIDDFVDTVGVDPFALEQPLNRYLTRVEGLNATLAEPGTLPDLTKFRRVQGEYRRIIAEVFDKFDLDGLFYPQATNELPLLDSDDFIAASTVYEANLAGVPVITLPGPSTDGVPFGVSFTGPANSEAELLALAYDYEQSEARRVLPQLQASV